MTPKHTPTLQIKLRPWSVAQYSDDGTITIMDKHREVVVICDNATKDCDALHIVKCVNTHDELVEALEAVDIYFKECARVWALNEGRVFNAEGKTVVTSENLDQLCNKAAELVALALKKASL